MREILLGHCAWFQAFDQHALTTEISPGANNWPSHTERWPLEGPFDSSKGSSSDWLPETAYGQLETLPGSQSAQGVCVTLINLHFGFRRLCRIEASQWGLGISMRGPVGSYILQSVWTLKGHSVFHSGPWMTLTTFVIRSLRAGPSLV